jgi:hypothetical protein
MVLLAPVSAAADDPSCPHHWGRPGAHAPAAEAPEAPAPEAASPETASPGAEGHGTAGAHHHGHHGGDHGHGTAHRHGGDHDPATAPTHGASHDHGSAPGHAEHECDCPVECGEMASPASPGLQAELPTRSAATPGALSVASDALLLPGRPAFFLPFSRPPPAFTQA